MRTVSSSPVEASSSRCATRIAHTVFTMSVRQPGDPQSHDAEVIKRWLTSCRAAVVMASASMPAARSSAAGSPDIGMSLTASGWIGGRSRCAASARKLGELKVVCRHPASRSPGDTTLSTATPIRSRLGYEKLPGESLRSEGGGRRPLICRPCEPSFTVVV